MPEDAIKIFYSYSRKDLDMRNTLEDHLASLRAAGKISTWHDLELEAGTEWEPAILNKLDTADIILLLISSNFIASKYCYGTELKRAIARHEAGTARVIPIILRPCDWNHADVPFSKLQALPTNALPISKWPDPEEAFAIVAQKIREVVDQMRNKTSSPIVSPRPPIVYPPKSPASPSPHSSPAATQMSLGSSRLQVPPANVRSLPQPPSAGSKTTTGGRINPDSQQQTVEEPYEKRLAHYQSQYLEASRRKYPVSDSDRHALESLRQVLRLSKDDVLTVEKRIEIARRPPNRPSSSPVQPPITQNSLAPKNQSSPGEKPIGSNRAEEVARWLKQRGINLAEEVARKLKGDMD